MHKVPGGMSGISGPGSDPSSRFRTQSTGVPLSRDSTTHSSEFIKFARGLLVARRQTDWARVREFHDKILTAARIKRADVDSLSAEQVVASSSSLPMLGKATLALAFWSIALNRSAYDDNHEGAQAFDSAAKSVALNPHNPEFVRSLWQLLRRNQKDPYFSEGVLEIDRELVATLSALSNYLEGGAKLRLPDFQLPKNWVSDTQTWQKHVGWALENYATILEVRARELKKRPGTGIGVVTQTQDLAEQSALRALEVSGVPALLSDMRGMGLDRNHPGWKSIDASQMARVGRAFRVLKKLASEPRRKAVYSDGGTAVRFDLAEQIAERFANESKGSLRRDEPALEQMLSQHFLLRPIELAELEKTALLPPRPSAVSKNSGAYEAATTWEEHFSQHRRAAEDRITMDDLTRLNTRVGALSLPVCLPQSMLLKSLATASAYAAASSFGEPTRVADFVTAYAKTALINADDKINLTSMLELYCVQCALRALKERKAGNFNNRITKLEVDRLLPLLSGKAQEIAEVLGTDAETRGIDRVSKAIEQVFEQIKVR